MNKDNPPASFGSSVINLVNTIIGAGVLAIPYAFRSSGVIPGVIILLFVYFSSSFAFHILSLVSEETRTFTFKGIAIRTSVIVGIFGEVCIFLYTVGNLVARIIIIADYSRDIFLDFVPQDISHYFYLQKWFLKIVCCIVIFPLSCLRNIDYLKFTSVIAVLCVIFSVFAVTLKFFFMIHQGKASSPLSTVSWFGEGRGFQTFISFGILIVSFCAHYNLPRMYEELNDRSVRKMGGIIWTSTTTCLLLYLTMGFAGYLSFGDSTDGNILDDYQVHDILILLTRVALSFALIFSTPLVLFACRGSLISLAFSRRRPQEEEPLTPSPAVSTNVSLALWILLTFLLIVGIGAIALLFPDIQLVFGYSGSTFGVGFIFLVPGICLLHTEVNGNLQDEPVQNNKMHRRLGGWFLIITGLVMGVLGTLGTSLKLFQGDAAQ